MGARQLWFALTGAATALVLSAPALACPRCATGGVVRAMAFGPAFWPNLLAISAPFIVLAAMTVACGRIGGRRAGMRPARREEH